MKFNDWVVGTYENTWEDIKSDLKGKGCSFEVILEEYLALYDNYKMEVLERD